MTKKTQDLNEFLIEELRDLYDAEKQLVKALPRMAKAATNEELGEAITEHLEVTKGQVQRLEQCFDQLEQKARTKPCKGLRGILEEGSEMLQEDMEDAVMDTAIAAGGRKIEHYEMVAYESLRGIAEQLGHNEIAELLGETLQEEEQADRRLTEICQRIVEQAAQAGEAAGTANMERSSSASAKGSRTQSASKGASGGRTRGAGASEQHPHGAHPLTDHDEIQQWAEERDAEPACVKGTMKGDTCMLRLDFPGYSGAESLEHISWDQWFQTFDKRKLALLVQEETASGEQSNFNKLVDRSTIEQKQGPKTRTAH
jgi:ferritin-like metal-binding protein YciE